MMNRMKEILSSDLNHTDLVDYQIGGQVQHAKTRPGSTMLMHFTVRWPSGDTYRGHAEGKAEDQIRASVVKHFEGADIQFRSAQ